MKNLWKYTIVTALVVFVGVLLSAEAASLYISSDMIPIVAGLVGGLLGGLCGILFRRLKDS